MLFNWGVARTFRPLLAITTGNILAKFVSRPSPSLFVPSGSIEHHNIGANLSQNLYRVTLLWEISEMGMILAMVSWKSPQFGTFNFFPNKILKSFSIY